jgi:cell division protease FtsH
MNEAALLAARRNRKDISMREVDEAIDRVIVGTEKRSRVISDREKRIVAYHEAGHTIVGYFLENADMVHKVTIIPRGRAGGYVIMMPKEDRMLVTKQELLDKVTGLLGGRVSEELFIGEIGTGAYSDFQQATGIVRSMIMEYGMSEKLGPLQFGSTQGQVFLGRDLGHEQNYSDSIAYEIDQEMQRMTNESYQRCKDLLIKHSKEVHLIANTLLEKETLELEQIKELIEQGYLSEDGPREDGNEGSSENGTPIIDTVGDVRVRIQGKEDASDLPVNEIPNDVPESPSDIPNDPTNPPADDPDTGNDGSGTKS